MEQGQVKLSQLLKHLKLSAKKLAESIGVSPTTIASIQSGQTKNISIGVATQICAVYKKINPDWLLNKSDQMLIEPVPNMNPYYNAFTIQGGIATGFGDEKAMTPDGYMAVPGIKPSPEIQFFQVKGDSMVNPENPSKSIPEGSWVAIKKNNDNDIWWGHIYAIMTLDGPIVKKVMQSDKGDDYIKIVSLNKEQFPPRDLNKNQIVGDMMLVVGVVNVQTL